MKRSPHEFLENIATDCDLAMALQQAIHNAIASRLESTPNGSAEFTSAGFRTPFLSERLKISTSPCCSCSRGPSLAVAVSKVAAVDENLRNKKPFARTKRLYTPKPAPSTPVPKLDKFGRLRTPRAARELALSVLYSAFVSSIHPLKVFEERVKQRAVAHSFDKSQLETYEHLPDVGENVVVEDESMALAMEEALEAESSLEAYVLTAPPPLVYNSFVIRMARSLVKETSERWLQQERVLMEIIPAKWKKQPKGALLQICILQMALAEIETLETPLGVVVNETVELTKRFCDLAAPRIVNGCLGSFIRRRKIQGNKTAVSVAEKMDRELVREPLMPEALLPEDLGFADEYTG